MKNIKVIQAFRDSAHDNELRAIGNEYLEQNDRADELIRRGFCELINVVEEKAVKVETAVKEEKKEKSIKEKVVRRLAPKK